MKSTELRIGNWLKKGTVVYLSDSDVRVYDGRNVLSRDNNEGVTDPIEISEEVLLKCGFAKSLNGDKFFWNHHGFHCEFDGEDWAVLPLAKGDLIIAYINHLHQLQNLYFEICKKDLIYTP